jgi:hypothetical protein
MRFCGVPGILSLGSLLVISVPDLSIALAGVVTCAVMLS